LGSPQTAAYFVNKCNNSAA